VGSCDYGQKIETTLRIAVKTTVECVDNVIDGKRETTLGHLNQNTL
jgi:hypothetical protein